MAQNGRKSVGTEAERRHGGGRARPGGRGKYLEGIPGIWGWIFLGCGLEHALQPCGCGGSNCLRPSRHRAYDDRLVDWIADQLLDCLVIGWSVGCSSGCCSAWKLYRNRLKICQTSINKWWKIYQTSINNCSKIDQNRSTELSWRGLGPSWPQDGPKSAKNLEN